MLKQALEERAQSTGIYGDDPYDAMLAEYPDLVAIFDDVQNVPGLSTREEQLRTLLSVNDLIVLKDRRDIADRLRTVNFARDDLGGVRYNPDGPNDRYLQFPSINAGDVPAYHWGGWRDAGSPDTVKLFANWAAPKRLVMGPWTHWGSDDPRDREGTRIKGIEQRRWFDYWLKGVKNGVLDEPAVAFAVVRHPDTEEIDGPPIDGFDWRFSSTFPTESASEQIFYFDNKPSGSVTSVNDGSLTSTPPNEEGTASFVVDYLSTMGAQTRYYDGNTWTYVSYPDLVAHAENALTFTSAPLEQALDVAGFPLISVLISSTEPDGEFNFYLEEVDKDGDVHHLTDSAVRASYATLGAAPFNNLGLPWHLATIESAKSAPSLNAAPLPLELALQPIANHFEKGSRIRLVITGADADNNLTIPYLPEPTQNLLIGGAKPGLLKLPIINTER
ncbi:MAG: CocE/NonD family hydrolase [Pseudomonadota bacterium]